MSRARSRISVNEISIAGENGSLPWLGGNFRFSIGIARGILAVPARARAGRGQSAVRTENLSHLVRSGSILGEDKVAGRQAANWLAAIYSTVDEKVGETQSDLSRALRLFQRSSFRGAIAASRKRAARV